VDLEVTVNMKLNHISKLAYNMPSLLRDPPKIAALGERSRLAPLNVALRELFSSRHGITPLL
jgi:hypothetical protein